MFCKKKLFIFILSFLLLIQNINSENRKKIALVLSGGLVRGIAHVGVLQILEENNIKPDYIIGTSTGAIIGGLYASGYSLREIEYIIKLTKNEILLGDYYNRSKIYSLRKNISDSKLFELRWDKNHLRVIDTMIYGNNLNLILNRYFSRPSFITNNNLDSLQIPFRAVSTNILTGSLFVPSKAYLTDAIRASLNVPIIFPPYFYENQYLVDGGLKANCPVNVALDSLKADIIIAVDVSEDLHDYDYVISNPLNYANQALTILMRNQTVEHTKKANILIQATSEDFKTINLNDTKQLIDLGREIAFKKLDDILALINQNSISTNKNQITCNDSPLIVNDSLLFSIEGNDVFTYKEIKDYLLCLEIKNKDEIKYFVEKLYIDKGYTLVETKWENNKLIINEGKIKRIDFVGNLNTKRWILFREMKMRKGKVFNVNDVENDIENLFNTQLFDFITYRVKKEDNEVILTYDFTEKMYGFTKFGLNYDTFSGAYFFQESGYDNFLGIDNSIYLQTILSEKGIKFQFNYLIPRIYDTYTGFKIQPSYSKKKYNLYNNSLKRIDKFEIEEIRLENIISYQFFVKYLNFYFKVGYNKNHIIPDSLFAHNYSKYYYWENNFELDHLNIFAFPNDGVKTSFRFKVIFPKNLKDNEITTAFNNISSVNFRLNKRFSLSFNSFYSLTFDRGNLPVTEYYKPAVFDFLGLKENEIASPNNLLIQAAVKYLLIKEFPLSDPKDNLALLTFINSKTTEKVDNFDKIKDAINKSSYTIGIATVLNIRFGIFTLDYSYSKERKHLWHFALNQVFE